MWSNKKFLVIRFSSIGDIVLATPAIRCLKMQVPGSSVHFLTKRSFKAVTEANPYIDRFHYFDNNLDELIGELKQENFDYIIDLHKNFRTVLIRLKLRVPVLSYQKLSFQKFLLTKFGIHQMPGRHITDRCLDAIAPTGAVNDGMGLDYFIPAGQHIRGDDIPLSHSAGFIAVVIGASYYTKKLPVEKLQELCGTINFPIILVGGKEDREEGEAIAAVDPVKIYNACGKFSLHESADIVRRSKLVISHDTGLQYIACAFNKKVLAIWGGTSPLLDVEPYYGEKQLLQHAGGRAYENFIVPGLSCQPCSNYGTRKCPKGHFRCMLNQDLPRIRETAEQFLR
ncbi:MAG: glycosyltransferase family 9 protein [Sphingobacteriia bacterium]|nr:glycosyltransferase family 9 protein [Sphingobacteriia bacterium]